MTRVCSQSDPFFHELTVVLVATITEGDDLVSESEEDLHKPTVTTLDVLLGVDILVVEKMVVV